MLPLGKLLSTFNTNYPPTNKKKHQHQHQQFHCMSAIAWKKLAASKTILVSTHSSHSLIHPVTGWVQLANTTWKFINQNILLNYVWTNISLLLLFFSNIQKLPKQPQRWSENNI